MEDPLWGAKPAAAKGDCHADKPKAAMILTPEQEHILHEYGTEPACSSPLNGEKRRGHYCCAGCSAVLFESGAKYDSGSGWPSFTQPQADAIGTKIDHSHGMERVEVHCTKCGGHLGHVFPDGPAPTGLRYCINGLALRFVPATK